MTTTNRKDLGTTAAAVLIATLGLAVTSWVFAVQQMNGMDLGVATKLGSLGSFVSLWVPMMAAMMLPGAVSAVVRATHASRRLLTVPLFVGSYLAVWALVGVAVYVMYRPHGPLAAGAVVIAAGVYEFTPFKQSFRGCCRKSVRSGFEFGLYCVGSSIGQMMERLGYDRYGAQKLMPAKAGIDVPLALGIIGLGILIIIAPSSVPGIMPTM